MTTSNAWVRILSLRRVGAGAMRDILSCTTVTLFRRMECFLCAQKCDVLLVDRLCTLDTCSSRVDSHRRKIEEEDMRSWGLTGVEEQNAFSFHQRFIVVEVSFCFLLVDSDSLVLFQKNSCLQMEVETLFGGLPYEQKNFPSLALKNACPSVARYYHTPSAQSIVEQCSVSAASLGCRHHVYNACAEDGVAHPPALWRWEPGDSHQAPFLRMPFSSYPRP